ncbi:MAG: phosphatase PAP2 family protein [Clostridia bacterium]|nr:phosphatase PAP2 family protein [Clostridia bacterium]
MTKDQYVAMTTRMRALSNRLPGGVRAFHMPTYLCAAVYIAALFHMMLLRDARLIRALLVPAACFLSVTALRPVIGKQRPYDRFGAPPVGEYKPGKGKSMPSRHTASAAAIAIAVAWLYPAWPVAAAMALLCALIAALRVLCGQHDLSDVLAAVLLSIVISLIGYMI